MISDYQNVFVLLQGIIFSDWDANYKFMFISLERFVRKDKLFPSAYPTDRGSFVESSEWSIMEKLIEQLDSEV